MSMYFHAFKGRNVEIGQLVEVYRNLNTPNAKAYSIRCAKTKLVLAHCETVSLKNAQFIVSEKLRLKVNAEKRKTVHAFIRGELVAYNKSMSTTLQTVYYNPYKTNSFVDAETQIPIYESPLAFVQGKFAYVTKKLGN